ncbi:hypothetical protein IFM89_035416 [Coptis chinensis]|uniref:Uncharacterized protein n=1 Tax=Coptis chinensis TaxID=261450 RepID=A0A835LNM0_9MAGN|nr:hypothetical protein IFM89_035416 [Coptis chinensis]
MGVEGANTNEAIIPNVALISGVTGLVGKQIAKSLTALGWKVYGVARNPDVLPIQDSDYHFITCDLLDPIQSMKKLSLLGDITHIFWVTWASEFPLDSQECSDQNKAMLSNALDGILPRAKELKHVSLQTGTKHYVSIGGLSNNTNACCYIEETPRTADGHNFYYALEDLLMERLSGKVAWSVHRPGLILGSSRRTIYNVMGCLGVYGTICKHLNLPFVFGGTRECWEEVYVDGSDARLVAEQHIWASTNYDASSKEGRAFNAINGTRFTWKEIWPALAIKFGVDTSDNMFSSSFLFSEFMVDKRDAWEEIVTKEGLCQTKIEDLANWAFLDTLFRCPAKMLANRDKANRHGFTTTYQTVDSILYWIAYMREERLIPRSGILGVNIVSESIQSNLHVDIVCLMKTGLSNIQGDDGDNNEKDNMLQGEKHVVLVEKYSNGTAKRSALKFLLFGSSWYILDGDSPIQSFFEESSVNGSQQASNSSKEELFWLPDNVKEFILPAGFPGSVSDDYLEYMVLQFPTNITAWVCHTLVTSSLLKAVGVGSFSGSTAAASAAAIRWVSKDGLGAIGRLFIGGRFGNLFDDDPKQWRMYADFIGSVGSIFDLSTPLYPAYFLPLAALGNLAKAVARGLKDPSFRVIQSHFAISENLGDVAAKEEVWEVAAQLFGLALGILVLDAPGIQSSYMTLALTWMSMRLLHLWLRYQSLSALKFNTVKALLKLYSRERYILVVSSEDQIDFKILISFKAGATSQSVLRSLWQSYWLHEHWEGSNNNAFDQLKNSLVHLDERFDSFLQLLEKAGWDSQQLKLKVPKSVLTEEIDSAESH